MAEFRDLALVKHLEVSPELLGNALSLYRRVEGLLAYVPATFPHYTDHTIRHSVEIVRQLSLLLFEDGSPGPVVRLSAAEAYVLVSAALLHDAGMTASDTEKKQILTSPEWSGFLAEDEDRKARWESIVALRAAAATVPAGQDQALGLYFAADLETRYLLGDFIRARHAVRSANVVLADSLSLLVGMNDPVLTRIVSSVCNAHGLTHEALDDPNSYPLTEDVQFGRVQTRLMAILLRLGDLLDVSYERACPLAYTLMIGSLPHNSEPHWTQFGRIQSRSTRPDEIRLSALCHTSDEHRILLDWFQAIEDEVERSFGLLSGTETVAWTPPRARVHGANPTLIVRPSADAKYVPSQWRFELDASAVFTLLSKDLYNAPEVFIRELLQNAFDASRCQLYDELSPDRRPAYPQHAPAELREALAIDVSLTTDAESGQQVLTVEDRGLGMDAAVIERFMLQVGRSYYTSAEFRTRYGFVPTSRFGVGLLSTFAVSDLIEIDTYKESAPSPEPLKVKLTGPRKYLIREPGTRTTRGTRVRVNLRTPLAKGQLLDLVTRWCRRVEFPVRIDELGRTSIVRAEEIVLDEDADLSVPGVRIVIRPFPIQAPEEGLFGELYVLLRRDALGKESWADWHWLTYRYREEYPAARLPQLPAPLLSLHGLALHREFPARYGGSWRLDVRAPTGLGEVALARSDPNSLVRDEDWIEGSAALSGAWAAILREHLEGFGPSGPTWQYLARLADSFSFLPTFWRTVRNAVPFYEGGRPALTSVAEAMSLVRFTVLCQVRHGRFAEQSPHESDGLEDLPCPEGRMLYAWDLPLLGSQYRAHSMREDLFGGRQPSSVTKLTERFFAVVWVMDPAADSYAFPDSARSRPQPVNYEYYDPRSLMSRPMSALDLSDLDPDLLGVRLHLTWDGTYEHVIFNSQHPLLQWMRSLFTVEAQGKLSEGTAARLVERAYRAVLYDKSDLYDKSEELPEGDELAGGEGFLEALEYWRQSPELDALAPLPSFARRRSNFGFAVAATEHNAPAEVVDGE